MSKFLADFREFILANGQNIYSVGEYCLGGEAEEMEIVPANACNNLYSVAKVFTMTAIGMLSDRGLLDVSETVSDILKNELPKNYHPYWKDTTVDMLLRHRIGLEAGALDIDGMDASAFDPDYLKEAATLPWSCPPGAEYHYTDAAFYIASRIAAKRAGMKLQNLLWENLFLPLGFKEAAWSTCPRGHAMGATGLYARSGDCVKLGGVYLQKGLWKNQRIISEAWVQRALERGYTLTPVRDTGAYQKGGMLGQNLLLIPHQGRAVCWIGHRREKQADLTRFALDYEG